MKVTLFRPLSYDGPFCRDSRNPRLSHVSRQTFRANVLTKRSFLAEMLDGRNVGPAITILSGHGQARRLPLFCDRVRFYSFDQLIIRLGDFGYKNP